MNYYWSNGNEQVYGPISQDELVTLRERGSIADTTHVIVEGESAWRTYADFFPRPWMPPPPPNTTASGAINQFTYLYISVSRLFWMSIISFGLYHTYWIYRNWRYIHDRSGAAPIKSLRLERPQMQPIWRGVFGVLYIYPLLKRIKNDDAFDQMRSASFSPGGLATGWIITTVLSNAISNAIIKAPDPDLTFSFVGVLVSALACCFLSPVQRHINTVIEASSVRPSFYHLSGGHIICLVIGLLVWLGIIVRIVS